LKFINQLLISRPNMYQCYNLKTL